MTSQPFICRWQLFIKAIRSSRFSSVATAQWLNDHHGDKWTKKEANIHPPRLAVVLAPSHPQDEVLSGREKLRKKKQSADLAFLPEEITLYYGTRKKKKKKTFPSHFVSFSYIFSQSSFLLCLSPSASSSSLRLPHLLNTLSWGYTKSWDGEIREADGKKKKVGKVKEPKGAKKEKTEK